MTRSVFQLVSAAEGWCLLDNGKPCFWFPEKDKALETACVMADARATFREEPASVHIQIGSGEFVQVAAFSP